MDEEQVYINRYIVLKFHRRGQTEKQCLKRLGGGSNEKKKKLRHTVLEYKHQSLSNFLMNECQRLINY